MTDYSKIPMWVLLIQFAEANMGSGGVLHVVLEDQNIEDSNIQTGIEACIAESDDLGLEIAKRMLKYSFGQRMTCLLIYDSATSMDVVDAYDLQAFQ